ncbi:MAG: hypothetical protein K2Y51_05865 [Gammaproteobacteria bacterium]|jgi:hypothetical protein|nr:hypothetical protein [Gammaproteobacteria bacterium]
MSMAVGQTRIWFNGLRITSAGVVAFGLVLVCCPGFTRRAFSLLVYASPDRLDGFGAEAARYIALVHAVLGGVMVGWGCLLYLVTTRALSRGEPSAWSWVTLSLLAWFVPDTAYSLLSGYWQNAVLNVSFLALFAVPLWKLRQRR